MKQTTVLFSLTLLVLLSKAATGNVMCARRINQCACETTDGKVIDLRPLDSKDPFNPRFWADAGGYRYTYNPCTPFHIMEEQAGCGGVAACQTHISDKCHYPAGHHVTLEFQSDEDGLYLRVYTPSTEVAYTRTSKIYLICDPEVEAKFEATGESGNMTGVYVMQLRSAHACPKDLLPVVKANEKMTPTPRRYHSWYSYIWHGLYAVAVLGILVGVVTLCLSKSRDNNKVILIRKKEGDFTKQIIRHV